VQVQCAGGLEARIGAAQCGQHLVNGGQRFEGGELDHQVLGGMGHNIVLCRRCARHPKCCWLSFFMRHVLQSLQYP